LVRAPGELNQKYCARMIMASDVGILPMKLGPETEGLDACKYYEYIAGRIPAVATQYQSEEYAYMVQTDNPIQFAEFVLFPPRIEEDIVSRLTQEADWRNRAVALHFILAKVGRINQSIRLNEEHP
jgi:hypothetical protein